MTRNQGRDEQDIEEVVCLALAGFVTRQDRTFDFDAGLADVYARAGLPVPVSSLVPPDRPRTSSGAGAAKRASDLIDTILSVLRTVAMPRPGPPASDLEHARQALAKLRGGLATRMLDGAAARRLLRLIDERIGRTDRTLRGLGSTLDDAIHGQIGGLVAERIDVARMVRDLRREVEAAFREEAGQKPADPQRRPAGSTKSMKEGGRWDSEAGIS